MMMHEHVRIAVTGASTPGFERVPAIRIGENEWRLLRSPLYAMDVASGDVVRVLKFETGDFEITKRGGNVCVQFYMGEAELNDARATQEASESIESELRTIGGSMDGRTPGLISFTMPVAAGFPAIERIFTAAAERYVDSEWQYANVYDPRTGEPLGWWSPDME